jgi:tryptophanase
LIPAQKVYIDLLSDSGTSALSTEQWARAAEASEDFAFQRGYDEFIETVRSLTGYRYVLPIHQARAAEHIIFSALLEPKGMVVGNHFFETTKENIRYIGGECLEIPGPAPDFPGNLDLNRLEAVLQSQAVCGVLISITSNRDGGQPAALENLKAAQRIAKDHRIPVIFDACRFAENAYFIKERERKEGSLSEIVRMIFSCADLSYLSAKKDGLSNIGGFIATNNATYYERLRELVMLFEGFFTHGGLTGRDLAIISRGLKEVLDEQYLRFRIEQVRFLAERLTSEGMSVRRPVGGHAVCIDASRLAPNIRDFTGYSLAAQVYLESGVRGGVFGERYEIFRLALPRRVYSNLQLEYVARFVAQVKKIKPLRPVYEPERLKHFLIRFRPI